MNLWNIPTHREDTWACQVYVSFIFILWFWRYPHYQEKYFKNSILIYYLWFLIFTLLCSYLTFILFSLLSFPTPSIFSYHFPDQNRTDEFILKIDKTPWMFFCTPLWKIILSTWIFDIFWIFGSIFVCTSLSIYFYYLSLYLWDRHRILYFLCLTVHSVYDINPSHISHWYILIKQFIDI